MANNLRGSIRAAVFIVVVGVCVLLTGCGDNGTTLWSQEVRSPDGQWLAIADTKQWSGPGNAYVATSVYLKQAASTQPPIKILGFSNESAYPSRIANVTIEWVAPKHLNVRYGSHATLDFQVIKCSGVDISVSEPPTENAAHR